MADEMKEALGKKKTLDPVLVIGVLLALVAGYLFLFPSKDREAENPESEFNEKVEAKEEREEARRESLQARFRESLEREGRSFEGSQAVREEQLKREEAERRFMELQEKVASKEERFPKTYFMEEIYYKSFQAPIGVEVESLGSEGYVSEVASSKALRKDPSALEKRVESRGELPVGTWIPTILNNDMDANIGGHGKALVKEHVYDRTGQHVLIPKGSRVVLEFAKGTIKNYFVSALTATLIELPNGQHIDMKFAGHNRRGIGGLNAKEEGTFDRHIWQKIGMSTLIAAISAAPSAIAGQGEIDDLAQLTFIDKATGFYGNVLKDSLNIPNDQVFYAGATVNLLTVDTLELPIYQGAHGKPEDASKAHLERLEQIKTKLFELQEQQNERFSREGLQDLLERSAAKTWMEGGQ